MFNAEKIAKEVSLNVEQFLLISSKDRGLLEFVNKEVLRALLEYKDEQLKEEYQALLTRSSCL